MDFWMMGWLYLWCLSLLGGLNYITTILNMRTKGMSMTRLPLTIWALFFTAILGVLSFPVLLSGFILLLFDRHWAPAFISLIFLCVNGKALPNEGGSCHPVPASVLVPGSPGSIYYYTAGHGSCFGSHVPSIRVNPFSDIWP